MTTTTDILNRLETEAQRQDRPHGDHDLPDHYHCGNMFRVNPRKRKRHKCCSPHCASRIRAAGRSSRKADPC
jgi:hypothetical protein